MTDPEHPTHKRPTSKWPLRLVLAIIILVFIANQVAMVALAWLLANKPTWLILLNPITRNLILVADRIDPVVFFLIASIRRMIPHIPWFFIGRWYGDKGIAWVNKFSPDTSVMLEKVETHFPKFGWLLLFLYPHPLVCAFAGASKMKFWVFFIFTTLGIIFFVAMAMVFGEWLSPVTGSLAGFAGKYWLPLTGVSIGALYLSYKYGGTKPVPNIENAEKDLEGTKNPK